MKLTVIAATGGIGREVVAQALAAGHDVTAVARRPERLSPTPARLVTADLASPDRGTLRAAVQGADAVLSALGPRSRADAGVTWRGTLAVTQAMASAGVRRILVVSAAPIGTVASPARPHPPRTDPGDGFIVRHLAFPVVRAVFRDNYADLARMEDVLRDSGLDWTAVRPPRLNSKPADRPVPDGAGPQPPARAGHLPRRRGPLPAPGRHRARDPPADRGPGLLAAVYHQNVHDQGGGTGR